MARPRTPIGTFGSISTTRPKKPGGSWVASTWFRDDDGVSRKVSRQGATSGAATASLKEALRDRKHSQGDGDLSSDDRFSKACDAWWSKVEAEDALAHQTRDQYERALKRIKNGMGERLVREVTVPSAERFLQTIRTMHGASSAKMAKSVLSNVVGYCTVVGAMEHNVVRDTSRIPNQPEEEPRALELGEVLDLRHKVAIDPVAIRRDVPEFIDFLLGTGIRISEGAAVRPDDLDLVSRLVDVSGIIVRKTGVGLVRTIRPNSKLKIRSLEMPKWLVAMLSERLDRMVVDGTFDAEGPVFPAPEGGWRDRSNSADDVRDALDAAGYDWVVPHTFRKTVLTEMDKAGHSARDGADRAGHSKPSMTQDKYWGRKKIVTAGVEVLERFGG